jgi:hypothetical protein
MNRKSAMLHLAALLLAPLVALYGAAPALHTFLTIHADAIGQRLQSAMIWADPSPDTPGITIAFRKTFALPVMPTQAALHLFADVRYVLWVNGTYVERGPNRFQPNGPEYDTINLVPHLKAGTNAVAVLVVGNLSGGKVMRHAPGLTAQLDVEGQELFHTDASWRWSDATRFRQVNASWPNLGESLVDARVEDGDWTQADYPDGPWKPATTIDGGAWGGLTARRMALLREKPVTVTFANGATLPVTLHAGEKLEFDTGRIVQAYPVIEMTADKDSELWIEPFGVRYLAKTGPQRHFTVDTRGLSKGALAVKSGKATITGFRLIERLYPFDRVGSFSCSDAFLNQLWTMCTRSCEVLSEDAYVDCADRERVEWMDCDPPAFDVTRIALAAPGADGKPRYGDPRLLGAMVRRTALTLQPDGWVKAHTCSDRYDIHAKMEDRACEWVAGIRRYYDATGDSALLREIWPAVVAQMNYFLERRTPRGLVRARDWVVWGNPLGYFTGETTTLNVFVQRALADAALIGAVIGEKETSTKFAKAATGLAQAINTVLWDEVDGCYYSGYFSDADVAANLAGKRKLGLPRINHLTATTLHANVFALDRGVVPDKRRSRVLQKMLEQQTTLKGGQVMIYYYVAKLLYGLDQATLDERVLEMWRNNWPAMVRSPWECSWESLGGGSHAHCYGMFPGFFLSAYVLGVRLDGTMNNRQLVIEPRLADLTRAEGVVVTGFGPVPVSWKRQANELAFRFVVPTGIQATLRLPDGDPSSLVFDGQRTQARMQGRSVTIVTGAGAHEGRLLVKPPPAAPAKTDVIEQRLSAKSAPVEIISRTTDASPAGLEADVVKHGLARIASVTEEGVVHDGGGTHADALHNGTTKNGAGGDETLNDGKTFRGYGAGSVITFQLAGAHDLTGIRTFAGHGDRRASQSYTVLVAYAGAPTAFVKLATAAVHCDAGASELRLQLNAAGVMAVRFELQNGPNGFNVYREINIVGKPTKLVP